MNRSDEPVAETWDGLDVARVLRIVAKEAAQGGDGLINGVLADGDITPGGVQERLAGNDFAGVFGQAKQHAQGARVEACGLVSARDLAGFLIHTPLANRKH